MMLYVARAMTDATFRAHRATFRDIAAQRVSAGISGRGGISRVSGHRSAVDQPSISRRSAVDQPSMAARTSAM
jgi:hypothetical protein